MAYSEEFQNTVINHFEEKRLDREYESNQLDRIQTMLDKNIEPTAQYQREIDDYKYVLVYVGLLLAGAMVTAALTL